MRKTTTEREPVHYQAPREQESTLLPMLIAGLVLIVLGCVIVMNFV